MSSALITERAIEAAESRFLRGSSAMWFDVNNPETFGSSRQGKLNETKTYHGFSERTITLKSFRYIITALLFAALTHTCWAGQDYKLYVNGVHYNAPSILEKGLPYFPVDVLSGATGVRVVSFSNTSVRLAGSPVDFVPVVRQGRPYLPAEAFALASGSGVEMDQTRGLVMYTGNASSAGSTVTASASSNPSANANAAQRANPGVTYDDPGPEAPVAAPPTAVQSSPNTEGIHETVLDAMKTAEEITYAQRWIKHKMYWANQMDPANSPYLRVNIPAGAGGQMYTPHPWATP
jgi:hypothetical protein